MRVNLGEDDGVEVQMAPLIDCVFLLLIFFLVATTLRKIERELPIELPQSAAAMDVAQVQGRLVISLDSIGGIHIGGEPVPLSVLHERLRSAAARNPNQRIRIDGDRRAPFQAVVHIVDLCQFEGLTRVSIRAAKQ